MNMMTQEAPATVPTTADVAEAAFAAQVAANPRAEEIGWHHCQQAADALGFVVDDDAQEELEEMTERLWHDHKASPRPKGARSHYAKDGGNGIPGWYAICDHRGYYMNVQFEKRSDADVYCYWRTQDLDEDEGSYCPALIEEDGGTRCDI